MPLGLLQSSPWAFAVLAVVLLWSLALHELGHAYVADLFGDKTARNLGRLSLNPLRHLEPLGTLLLFVVGFGWAKPVPIQPANFRRQRAGLFFVSLAGVTANLLIALAALAVLAWLGLRLDASGDAYLAPGAALARLPGKLGQGVFLGLYWAAHINLVLAVFNLLPIPPLDGSKVVQSLAPAGWQPLFARLERFGFLLVVAVLLLFNRQVFALIARLEGLVMHLILG